MTFDLGFWLDALPKMIATCQPAKRGVLGRGSGLTRLFRMFQLICSVSWAELVGGREERGRGKGKIDVEREGRIRGRCRGEGRKGDLGGKGREKEKRGRMEGDNRRERKIGTRGRVTQEGREEGG